MTKGRSCLDVMVVAAEDHHSRGHDTSAWERSVLSALADVEDCNVHRLRASPPFNDIGSRVSRLLRTTKIDAVIADGVERCSRLARSPSVRGRLWPYLADTDSMFLDPRADILAQLGDIGDAARFVLCETEDVRSYLDATVPGMGTKTVVVPLLFDPSQRREQAPMTATGGPTSVISSVDFVRHWTASQIDELASFLEGGTARRIKFHLIDGKDDDGSTLPASLQRVLEDRLGTTVRACSAPGSGTHEVALFWRPPVLEHSLRCPAPIPRCCVGVTPPIVTMTPTYRRLLGDQYPLYATTWGEAIDLLRTIALQPDMLWEAREVCISVAKTLGTLASERLAQLLGRIRPIDRPTGRSRRGTTRIVVASHDLKFFTEVGHELSRFEHTEIKYDHWWALDAHDERQSRKLLKWADLVICEWCGPNAVWYSRHRRADGPRIITRLHRFELDSGFPHRVRGESLDAVVTVTDRYRHLLRREVSWRDDTTVVIPNAVDEMVFDREKLPGAQFCLGMIGIVPRLKRLDRALDLLRELRRDDERFTLRVKSSMPWEVAWCWRIPEEVEHIQSQFHRITTDPLLIGAVSFDTAGSDVAVWLRQIGHILSCSDLESFHLAAAEGMMSGAVPSIFPWKGARTLYGERWLRIGVADAAAHVLAIASDCDRWDLERAAAQEFARAQFASANVMERWRSLIESVLQKSPERALSR